MPETQDAVTAGVDLAAVGRWMDEQGFDGGEITRVEPLAGGTQNVLLRFRRAGQDFVLRRGPLHLRPRSNDVVRREMRVLDALNGTGVAHPRLIAACADETVLGGAVFYLMEPIEGFNPSTTLPSPHAGDSAMRHAMGLAAVDALATLGEVDHEAAGLGDLGKPGFLERQVPRWLSELDSYGKLEGYPGPDIPAVEAVAKWLEDNRPATSTAGILHGDYHLANLLYRFDGPAVAAIVDWEMCTVGDPLLDLGWLLVTWPVSDPEFDALPTTAIGGKLADAGGLPAPADLIERYAERSSRDLSAITWYNVLACFKLGIVLEGTHARACAGKAPREMGDSFHGVTLGLFGRAQAWIARS